MMDRANPAFWLRLIDPTQRSQRETKRDLGVDKWTRVSRERESGIQDPGNVLVPSHMGSEEKNIRVWLIDEREFMESVCLIEKRYWNAGVELWENNDRTDAVYGVVVFGMWKNS